MQPEWRKSYVFHVVVLKGDEFDEGSLLLEVDFAAHKFILEIKVGVCLCTLETADFFELVTVLDKFLWWEGFFHVELKNGRNLINYLIV